MESNHSDISTVYGPVHSWRVGMSLGIDLICHTSVCSFNCIYCQLGHIQVVTDERQCFISTEKVIQDFHHSRWKESDILTFSGSGEPTLATNLGAVAQEIKKITSIPQLVLTNGVHLNEPAVIKDLQHVDKVFVKLDASNEEIFQRVNRPVNNIYLTDILRNIELFKPQFKGYFGIQTMFLHANLKEMESLGEMIAHIQPDELQLNTPKRPYPKYWHINSRGGHTEELRGYEATPLKTISQEKADEIEDYMRKVTGVKVISVYG